MEESESIRSTKINVDGDVSIERLQYLIDLEVEEERLDYKEDLDFQNNKVSKKAKIDLVCDCISIANTYGGYLIFGVKEVQGKFQVKGVSPRTIKYLTSDTINSLLKQYVNDSVSVKSNIHIVMNCEVVIVFITKLKRRIPFNKDGQYVDEKEKEITKFREGEIFIRHASKSERANYNDTIEYEEQIRKDERQKFLNNTNFDTISGKLDDIISLLSGEPKRIKIEQVFKLSYFEIEEYFYSLFSKENRARLIKRVLTSFYEEIKGKYVELETENDYLDLKESINRITDTYLSRLVPIWESVVSQDKPLIGKFFIEKLYEIYLLTFQLGGIFYSRPSNRLLIQKEIIQIVYILGAISIDAKQIEPNLKDLVTKYGEPKNSPFPVQNEKASWFRYVYTQLSKLRDLEMPSLVHLAFSNYKESEYIIELFGSQDNFLAKLNQVDYFQCLQTLLSGLNISDCFPSFKIYSKAFVNDFLYYFILEYKEWNEEYKIKLANAIKSIEEYEIGGGYIGWRGVWQPEIVNFISQYSKK